MKRTASKTVGQYLRQNGLQVLLAAAACLSCLTLLFMLHTTNESSHARETFMQAYRLRQQTGLLYSSLQEAERALSTYVHLKDPSSLQAYHQSRQDVSLHQVRIRQLDAAKGDRQDLLSQLSEEVEQKLRLLQESLQYRGLTDSIQRAAALSLTSSDLNRQKTDRIKSLLAALEKEETLLMEANARQLARSERMFSILLWMSSLCGLMALIRALLFMRRQKTARDKLFLELDQNNRALLFNPGNRQMEITEKGAIRSLIDNLNHAKHFIRQVGQQQYDTPYLGLSPDNEALNKDNLAGALLEMRTQMQQLALSESKRHWANQGIALFADILRKEHDSLQALCLEITSTLVRYVNANQAALFLINDELADEPRLELAACYAYERRKWVEKSLSLDEGLLGAACLEKDVIYMTDIPRDYIRITSGLGDATPSCLLIVPLLLHEDVLGVLEMASFRNFEPHEVELVKKLAESIAATVASGKVKEHTRRLLEQAQLQAEELKAQEEEMRQSIEELAATQEELHRKEQGYLKRIQELELAGHS